MRRRERASLRQCVYGAESDRPPEPPGLLAQRFGWHETGTVAEAKKVLRHLARVSKSGGATDSVDRGAGSPAYGQHERT